MITKNCYKRTNYDPIRLAKLLLLVFFVLQTQLSYSQLSSFSLSVTKTDETCLGNGTLSFSTAGTTAGSTITYYVYQLPDATNPIAVQTNPFLGGRTSGTYQIMALQTLGSWQNSQTETITINSVIVPLAYTLSSTDSACNDGTITVTVTSGIGQQYEIISGPILKPLQSSPIFTQLPGGVYQVRVYDNCGDATVVTHTVLSSTVSLTIGPVGFPSPQLPSCNSIIVSNALSAGANQSIRYPLSLTYVVHFPNTTTQTIHQTISSGSPTQEIAAIEIPLFYDQEYYYDLTVVDGCGNTYVLNNNIIDVKLTASLAGQIAECGTYYLTASASFYGGNLQIQFTDAPVGFNPIAFNASHPGPFAGPSVDYGNFTNPVPYGHYAILITDDCGHSATAEITLEFVPVFPTHEAEPWPGCQSNKSDVIISIPSHLIVSGIITAAPAAYPFSLPNDVSTFINADGEIELVGLITGNYTIDLVDECGNTYTYNFFVADVTTSVAASSWPSCEIGKGSIRIRGNNTLLLSVTMTSAPTEFNQTLPFNASSYISSNSVFSMIDLPPGNYSFKVLDSCGIENNVTVAVVGYTIFSNNFSLTPNCGSFDLFVQHNSNAVSQVFWLQKYNPVNNTWVHPLTGDVYIDGNQPNTTNSLLIQNNIPTLNLAFLGNFRIIKSFQTFENGTVGAFKTCLETIKEFEFTGEIQFTGIEKTNCNGLYMDIKLYAIGAPPLIYSIIEKDGLPFNINNGTSNQFFNLEPAIYTFKVEQSCGDSRNFISDVALLPSLATAYHPNDIGECDDVSNDGIGTFNLASQDSAILGSQNPSLYAITYHLSSSDAATNTNPLPLIYTSTNATIYARLQYLSVSDCLDITSFNIVVNPLPDGNPIAFTICEGVATTLSADNGYSSYQWSTGENTQSIVVSQDGQYTVTVVKDYPTGSCTGQFTYNITTTKAPVIDHLVIQDWTDNENSIEVILENTDDGDFLYSIDGLHFQESNIFYNLIAGPYTVIVKDTSDCGIDTATVYLLNYPKYFTPNGDGIHEYWKVKHSDTEPNMMTYIFDRYGKLITGFNSLSLGWDGKLNGHQLPSTDYWFLIIREDGREHLGHFTLKR